MNYRHLYHAGSFSDVVKHIVLIAVLDALKRKETSLCYLDTHAGIGLYPLQSVQALKTQEYQTGIAQLISADVNHAPDIVCRYIALIKNIHHPELSFYPGSPCIAQSLLRQQDALILSELHPDDYQTLKINMGQDARISIHHTDAYLAMKAFLPPKQKRGLVLIDPPFEKIDEFEKMIHALQSALTHWRSGHFMVWYPLKNLAQINQFYRSLRAFTVESFKIHFHLNHADETGKMTACGILLINPPWKVKELLQETVLPYLAETLNARYKIIV